ncbi:MAG TPA: hypothetical protein VFX17_04355 [Patescibacteria group bacterium]|nr:hypothetical protein [Patescibacteria group bacterium]
MPGQSSHKLKADSFAEISTKAERRESKNRQRMKQHGASLKRPSKFSGLKLAKKK